MTVEGYERTPDDVLPPKKKLWEAVMPNLKVIRVFFSNQLTLVHTTSVGNRLLCSFPPDLPSGNHV